MGRIDYALSYLAWPGWHIASGVTVAAGQWQLASYLFWISLPLAICGGLAGVMLLTRIVGRGRLLWATLLVMAPLAGTLAFPLPGNIAVFLWVLMLVLCSDEAWSGARPSAGRRVVLLLLAAGVIVTHLLTTIAMLASLILVGGFGRIFGGERLNPCRVVWLRLRLAVPLLHRHSNDGATSPGSDRDYVEPGKAVRPLCYRHVGGCGWWVTRAHSGGPCSDRSRCDHFRACGFRSDPRRRQTSPTRAFLVVLRWAHRNRGSDDARGSIRRRDPQ